MTTIEMLLESSCLQVQGDSNCTKADPAYGEGVAKALEAFLAGIISVESIPVTV